jgi:hypothetical protein
MSPEASGIVRRRQALVARSRAQRDRLGAALADVRRSLWLLDGAARGLQLVRARPLLSASVAAAVLLLAPRRLLFAALRGVVFGGTLLRLGRSIRTLF